jgi:hypothetical protein
MAHTDPRHAYVRFYLTVLAQFDEVHAALARTAGEIRTAVMPFADVLAVAEDPDLARLAAGDAPALTTADLWRPQDPALLTGITDVYEVVGRFSFQGEDDTNLARVAAAVRDANGEVERQRRVLAALAKLPAIAAHHAEGLSQQELQAEEAARARRLEPFAPVAAQLREQCEKVHAAVMAIPRPDLSDLAQADALYQEYVRRMQALYTKALPFLRRALQELCAVAQVEVPPSWPDTLPFAPSLPPELVTPPPAETPAMAQLRAQLEQMEVQEHALARAVDEHALTLRRIEAERTALAQREAEIMAEAVVAKNMVRWATRLDELDAILQALAGQHQQKQSRAALAAQLAVQLQQLEAQAAALAGEVAQREQEVAATAATLADKRANPPALFGKEEWRRAVQDLEEDLEERQATLRDRRAVHAQLARDLSSVQARAAAEQAQLGVLDRALADAQAREQLLRKEVGEIEQQLGAHRPAHRLSVQQADEYLTQLWAARNEVRGRLDYLANQQRRTQEEIDRAGAQAKQIAQDRPRLRQAYEQAAREGAVARAEALEALAQRRQHGFEQYVGQVLAPFEESLLQVDRIFIEPARQVLLQRSVGETHKAGSLRAQAEGLAQALAKLVPQVEPALTAQAEVLKRVQADFCDKVQDAVRAAWAG